MHDTTGAVPVGARTSGRVAEVPYPRGFAQRIGFGCGGRAELMLSDDHAAQRAVIDKALSAGIRTFDTAQLYGEGKSEANLGRALGQPAPDVDIVLSTKIDVHSPEMTEAEVLAAVRTSLSRLKRDQVSVVFVHNRLISDLAGQRPVHAPGPALTSAELSRDGGVLEGLMTARANGLIERIGLTGFGSDCKAVEAVIAGTGAIDVVSVEYSLLNQSARTPRTDEVAFRLRGEQDYSEMAAVAAAHSVALMGMRPLVGGLLVHGPSAAHPQDAELLAELAAVCRSHNVSLPSAAWQFACTVPTLPVVIGGFRDADDLEVAVSAARQASHDTGLVRALTSVLRAREKPALVAQRSGEPT